MAVQIDDRTLDFGLNELDAVATGIYICASAEPTTYAIATTTASTTGALGWKTFAAGGLFGSPAAATDANGRRVTSTSITDGTIVTNGTAHWWAVVDSANSRLLAHGTLQADQAVTGGNTFTLSQFDIVVKAR